MREILKPFRSTSNYFTDNNYVPSVPEKLTFRGFFYFQPTDFL